MNKTINEVPKSIKGFTDKRWENSTIYNHYNSPLEFRKAVLKEAKNSGFKDFNRYLSTGEEAFEKISSIVKDSPLYEDVAKKVKSKLQARGFTTKMLYKSVEFTTENTGVLSKQRAMLGRRDCYYKDNTISDKKLFHDIYINLSYSFTISDSVIKENSYALYALTKELARLIPIRVFVVNHVGTYPSTCYSYNLKQFGRPINPETFLFFTSDSKRTYGWATYEMLAKDSSAEVGYPTNTVSIANFNLDTEIDTIWEKISSINPKILRRF